MAVEEPKLKHNLSSLERDGFNIPKYTTGGWRKIGDPFDIKEEDLTQADEFVFCSIKLLDQEKTIAIINPEDANEGWGLMDKFQAYYLVDDSKNVFLRLAPEDKVQLNKIEFDNTKRLVKDFPNCGYVQYMIELERATKSTATRFKGFNI